MRNTELEKLDGLVGEWTTTLSDAWFLELPGTEVAGTTTVSIIECSPGRRARPAPDCTAASAGLSACVARIYGGQVGITTEQRGRWAAVPDGARLFAARPRLLGITRLAVVAFLLRRVPLLDGPAGVFRGTHRQPLTLPRF